MNVWVVSFDESESSDDPTLRVFYTRSDALTAIVEMCAETPFVVDAEITAEHDFTFNYFDPDEGDRLSVALQECVIERARVTSKEV